MTKNYPLYDGKVNLLFDDKYHRYTVNGKTVYGVTTAIGVLDKPALKYWAVNMGIEYLKENLKVGEALDEIQVKDLLEGARTAHTKRLNKAADAGTLVHEWIEKYIKARIAKKPVPKRPINPEMKSAVDGFFKWAKQNKVQLILSEQKIYSKKWKFAGTLDIEAIVNGKKTMVDIKTSNGIYPEYFLQTAAYTGAREEEMGQKYDGGAIILRLSKESKEKEISPFEVASITAEETKTYFKVFLNCLQIYKWKMLLKKQEIIKKVNNN